MAVNTITFGGVNSADYGIYISGEGVFNAPVRDAEMISIPGRDGSFLLDNGRYENIEVTYPAFNTETDKATFIAQVDAFRNAIASQKGYQRLEDTFHTDEYRMASFIGGLEINPVLYNDHTSQFEIVFNCKPQRFLKSGESAVAKANNSTITNPTLFDAHPLLKFNSNGNDGEINFGNQQIKILNAILGRVYLGLDVTGSRTSVLTWQDNVTVQDLGSFNTGDTILFNGGKVIFTLDYIPITVEVISQSTDLRASWVRGSKKLELSLDNLQFSVGTGTTYSYSCNIKVKASDTPLLEETKTFTVTASCSRDGILTVTWTGGDYSFGAYTYIQSGSNYIGYGDSTKNSLENVDIYIDLDIGEAYSVDSGDNAVSLNNFVNIGGELPVLAPGNTTITYDNTISNFKITPRWWKI